MHQPKITQLGFQCLLDSGVCFPAHAQEKNSKTKQNPKKSFLMEICLEATGKQFSWNENFSGYRWSDSKATPSWR